MKAVALSFFTVGLMFALHTPPREPWGVLGLGDIFAGYVFVLIGAAAYVALVLRRQRAVTRRNVTVLVPRTQERRIREAA